MPKTTKNKIDQRSMTSLNSMVVAAVTLAFDQWSWKHNQFVSQVLMYLCS